MDICFTCGKPAECSHHLLFGNSIRRLADEDGIYLSMCNQCHNMAVDATSRIHGNVMAEKLSKMLGQALWEREYIANYIEDPQIEAREAFRKRYGRSWL